MTAYTCKRLWLSRCRSGEIAFMAYERPSRFSRRHSAHKTIVVPQWKARQEFV